MDWQQYFPTYHFDEKKNRDIALEEYKFCCKVVESEERIFDNLIKYILAFGTILISLLTGMGENLENIFIKIIEIDNLKYIWYFMGMVFYGNFSYFVLCFYDKKFCRQAKIYYFCKTKNHCFARNAWDRLWNTGVFVQKGNA